MDSKSGAAKPNSSVRKACRARYASSRRHPRTARETRPIATILRVTNADERSDLPRPGMTPLELTRHLLARIDEAHAYARARRSRFRRSSSALRLGSLALSAASTIILGLQDLDFWTGLGFAFVTVATVVNTLEPYFAWRSRWVLMEETQYRFNRLRDEVHYYLAETPADDLDSTRIRELFDQYQEIWDQLSMRWLESRKPGPGTQ